MLNGSRVLVTGGTGFIGSHLCERLLQDGHEVLCVDNFYTGTRSNVRHLFSRSNFELVRHDVCFPLWKSMRSTISRARPLRSTISSIRSNDQDKRPRCHQYAWPRQAHKSEDPPGFDLRGLWRSIRPSPDRGLLGQRQPDRPAFWVGVSWCT
jgi:hypothetical protein